MPPTAKVSISLPVATLRRADARCRATGKSRSELFQGAVLALLDGEKEDQAGRRYVAGYLATPESAAETQALTVTAANVLAGEPWD